MNKKDYEIFEKLLENKEIKPNFNNIKSQTKGILDYNKRIKFKTIKLLKIILKYAITISILMMFMLIISIIGFNSDNFNQDLFIKLFLILSIIFTAISLSVGFVIALKIRRI